MHCMCMCYACTCLCVSECAEICLCVNRRMGEGTYHHRGPIHEVLSDHFHPVRRRLRQELLVAREFIHKYFKLDINTQAQKLKGGVVSKWCRHWHTWSADWLKRKSPIRATAKK